MTVSDNSGAKTVKCIGFSCTRSVANIGDSIIVSVRTLIRNSGIGADRLRKTDRTTIQKGQIYKALITRSRRGINNRKYGHRLAFDNNDVVPSNTQGSLLGSRISGPLTRELRERNLIQILSQSERIL